MEERDWFIMIEPPRARSLYRSFKLNDFIDSIVVKRPLGWLWQCSCRICCREKFTCPKCNNVIKTNRPLPIKHKLIKGKTSQELKEREVKEDVSTINQYMLGLSNKIVRLPINVSEKQLNYLDTFGLSSYVIKRSNRLYVSNELLVSILNWYVVQINERCPNITIKDALLSHKLNACINCRDHYLFGHDNKQPITNRTCFGFCNAYLEPIIEEVTNYKIAYVVFPDLNYNKNILCKYSIILENNLYKLFIEDYNDSFDYSLEYLNKLNNSIFWWNGNKYIVNRLNEAAGVVLASISIYSKNCVILSRPMKAILNIPMPDNFSNYNCLSYLNFKAIPIEINFEYINKLNIYNLLGNRSLEDLINYAKAMGFFKLSMTTHVVQPFKIDMTSLYAHVWLSYLTMCVVDDHYKINKSLYKIGNKIGKAFHLGLQLLDALAPKVIKGVMEIISNLCHIDIPTILSNLGLDGALYSKTIRFGKDWQNILHMMKEKHELHHLDDLSLQTINTKVCYHHGKLCEHTGSDMCSCCGIRCDGAFCKCCKPRPREKIVNTDPEVEYDCDWEEMIKQEHKNIERHRSRSINSNNTKSKVNKVKNIKTIVVHSNERSKTPINKPETKLPLNKIKTLYKFVCDRCGMYYESTSLYYNESDCPNLKNHDSKKRKNYDKMLTDKFLINVNNRNEAFQDWNQKQVHAWLITYYNVPIIDTFYELQDNGVIEELAGGEGNCVNVLLEGLKAIGVKLEQVPEFGETLLDYISVEVNLLVKMVTHETVYRLYKKTNANDFVVLVFTNTNTKKHITFGKCKNFFGYNGYLSNDPSVPLIKKASIMKKYHFDEKGYYNGSPEKLRKNNLNSEYDYVLYSKLDMPQEGIEVIKEYNFYRICNDTVNDIRKGKFNFIIPIKNNLTLLNGNYNDWSNREGLEPSDDTVDFYNSISINLTNNMYDTIANILKLGKVLYNVKTQKQYIAESIDGFYSYQGETSIINIRASNLKSLDYCFIEKDNIIRIIQVIKLSTDIYKSKSVFSNSGRIKIYICKLSFASLIRKLYAISRTLQDSAEHAKYYVVKGYPGTGKSRLLRERYKSRSMIVCQTNRGMRHLRELIPECKDIYTLEQAIINIMDDDYKECDFRYLYVDEAEMMRPVDLYPLSRKFDNVELYGDVGQIGVTLFDTAPGTRNIKCVLDYHKEDVFLKTIYRFGGALFDEFKRIYPDAVCACPYNTEVNIIRLEDSENIIKSSRFDVGLSFHNIYVKELGANGTTVHKYQGNEEDVVLVLQKEDKGGSLICRSQQYVVSAMTRARKKLIWITQYKIGHISESIDSNIKGEWINKIVINSEQDKQDFMRTWAKANGELKHRKDHWCDGYVPVLREDDNGVYFVEPYDKLIYKKGNNWLVPVMLKDKPIKYVLNDFPLDDAGSDINNIFNYITANHLDSIIPLRLAHKMPLDAIKFAMNQSTYEYEIAQYEQGNLLHLQIKAIVTVDIMVTDLDCYVKAFTKLKTSLYEGVSLWFRGCSCKFKLDFKKMELAVNYPLTIEEIQSIKCINNFYGKPGYNIQVNKALDTLNLNNKNNIVKIDSLLLLKLQNTQYYVDLSEFNAVIIQNCLAMICEIENVKAEDPVDRTVVDRLKLILLNLNCSNNEEINIKLDQCVGLNCCSEQWSNFKFELIASLINQTTEFKLDNMNLDHASKLLISDIKTFKNYSDNIKAVINNTVKTNSKITLRYKRLSNYFFDSTNTIVSKYKPCNNLHKNIMLGGWNKTMEKLRNIHLLTLITQAHYKGYVIFELEHNLYLLKADQVRCYWRDCLSLYVFNNYKQEINQNHEYHYNKYNIFKHISKMSVQEIESMYDHQCIFKNTNDSIFNMHATINGPVFISDFNKEETTATIIMRIEPDFTNNIGPVYKSDLDSERVLAYRDSPGTRLVLAYLRGETDSFFGWPGCTDDSNLVLLTSRILSEIATCDSDSYYCTCWGICMQGMDKYQKRDFVLMRDLKKHKRCVFNTARLESKVLDLAGNLVLDLPDGDRKREWVMTILMDLCNIFNYNKVIKGIKVNKDFMPKIPGLRQDLLDHQINKTDAWATFIEARAKLLNVVDQKHYELIHLSNEAFDLMQKQIKLELIPWWCSIDNNIVSTDAVLECLDVIAIHRLSGGDQSNTFNYSSCYPVLLYQNKRNYIPIITSYIYDMQLDHVYNYNDQLEIYKRTRCFKELMSDYLKFVKEDEKNGGLTYKEYETKHNTEKLQSIQNDLNNSSDGALYLGPYMQLMTLSQLHKLLTQHGTLIGWVSKLNDCSIFYNYSNGALSYNKYEYGYNINPWVINYNNGIKSFIVNGLRLQFKVIASSMEHDLCSIIILDKPVDHQIIVNRLYYNDIVQTEIIALNTNIIDILQNYNLFIRRKLNISKKMLHYLELHVKPTMENYTEQLEYVRTNLVAYSVSPGKYERVNAELLTTYTDTVLLYYYRKLNIGEDLIKLSQLFKTMDDLPVIRTLVVKIYEFLSKAISMVNEEVNKLVDKVIEFVTNNSKLQDYIDHFNFSIDYECGYDVSIISTVFNECPEEEQPQYKGLTEDSVDTSIKSIAGILKLVKAKISEKIKIMLSKYDYSLYSKSVTRNLIMASNNPNNGIKEHDVLDQKDEDDNDTNEDRLEQLDNKPLLTQGCDTFDNSVFDNNTIDPSVSPYNVKCPKGHIISLNKDTNFNRPNKINSCFLDVWYDCVKRSDTTLVYAINNIIRYPLVHDIYCPDNKVALREYYEENTPMCDFDTALADGNLTSNWMVTFRLQNDGFVTEEYSNLVINLANDFTDDGFLYLTKRLNELRRIVFLGSYSGTTRLIIPHTINKGDLLYYVSILGYKHVGNDLTLCYYDLVIKGSWNHIPHHWFFTDKMTAELQGNNVIVNMEPGVDGKIVICELIGIREVDQETKQKLGLLDPVNIFNTNNRALNQGLSLFKNIMRTSVMRQYGNKLLRLVKLNRLINQRIMNDVISQSKTFKVNFFTRLKRISKRIKDLEKVSELLNKIIVKDLWRRTTLFTHMYSWCVINKVAKSKIKLQSLFVTAEQSFLRKTMNNCMRLMAFNRAITITNKGVYKEVSQNTYIKLIVRIRGLVDKVVLKLRKETKLFIVDSINKLKENNFIKDRIFKRLKLILLVKRKYFKTLYQTARIINKNLKFVMVTKRLEDKVKSVKFRVLSILNHTEVKLNLKIMFKYVVNLIRINNWLRLENNSVLNNAIMLRRIVGRSDFTFDLEALKMKTCSIQDDLNLIKNIKAFCDKEGWTYVMNKNGYKVSKGSMTYIINRLAKMTGKTKTFKSLRLWPMYNRLAILTDLVSHKVDHATRIGFVICADVNGDHQLMDEPVRTILSLNNTIDVYVFGNLQKSECLRRINPRRVFTIENPALLPSEIMSIDMSNASFTGLLDAYKQAFNLNVDELKKKLKHFKIDIIFCNNDYPVLTALTSQLNNVYGFDYVSSKQNSSNVRVRSVATIANIDCAMLYNVLKQINYSSSIDNNSQPNLKRRDLVFGGHMSTLACNKGLPITRVIQLKQLKVGQKNVLALGSAMAKLIRDSNMLINFQTIINKHNIKTLDIIGKPEFASKIAESFPRVKCDLISYLDYSSLSSYQVRIICGGGSQVDFMDTSTGLTIVLCFNADHFASNKVWADLKNVEVYEYRSKAWIQVQPKYQLALSSLNSISSNFYKFFNNAIMDYILNCNNEFLLENVKKSINKLYNKMQNIAIIYLVLTDRDFAPEVEWFCTRHKVLRIYIFGNTNNIVQTNEFETSIIKTIWNMNKPLSAVLRKAVATITNQLVTWLKRINRTISIYSNYNITQLVEHIHTLISDPLNININTNPTELVHAYSNANEDVVFTVKPKKLLWCDNTLVVLSYKENLSYIINVIKVVLNNLLLEPVGIIVFTCDESLVKKGELIRNYLLNNGPLKFKTSLNSINITLMSEFKMLENCELTTLVKLDNNSGLNNIENAVSLPTELSLLSEIGFNITAISDNDLDILKTNFLESYVKNMKICFKPCRLNKGDNKGLMHAFDDVPIDVPISHKRLALNQDCVIVKNKTDQIEGQLKVKVLFNPTVEDLCVAQCLSYIDSNNEILYKTSDSINNLSTVNDMLKLSNLYDVSPFVSWNLDIDANKLKANDEITVAFKSIVKDNRLSKIGLCIVNGGNTNHCVVVGLIEVFNFAPTTNIVQPRKFNKGLRDQLNNERNTWISKLMTTISIDYNFKENIYIRTEKEHMNVNSLNKGNGIIIAEGIKVTKGVYELPTNTIYQANTLYQVFDCGNRNSSLATIIDVGLKTYLMTLNDIDYAGVMLNLYIKNCLPKIRQTGAPIKVTISACNKLTAILSKHGLHEYPVWDKHVQSDYVLIHTWQNRSHHLYNDFNLNDANYKFDKVQPSEIQIQEMKTCQDKRINRCCYMYGQVMYATEFPSSEKAKMISACCNVNNFVIDDCLYSSQKLKINPECVDKKGRIKWLINAEDQLSHLETLMHCKTTKYADLLKDQELTKLFNVKKKDMDKFRVDSYGGLGFIITSVDKKTAHYIIPFCGKQCYKVKSCIKGNEFKEAPLFRWIYKKEILYESSPSDIAPNWHFIKKGQFDATYDNRGWFTVKSEERHVPYDKVDRISDLFINETCKLHDIEALHITTYWGEDRQQPQPYLPIKDDYKPTLSQYDTTMDDLEAIDLWCNTLIDDKVEIQCPPAIDVSNISDNINQDDLIRYMYLRNHQRVITREDVVKLESLEIMHKHKYPEISYKVITNMAYAELNTITNRSMNFMIYRNISTNAETEIKKFIQAYLRPDWREITAEWRNSITQITVQPEEIKQWLLNRKRYSKKVQDLDAALEGWYGVKNFTDINFMLKEEVLTKDDYISLFNEQKPRPILYHYYFVAAMFSVMFQKCKARLKDLLRNEIVYTDGLRKDEIAARLRLIKVNDKRMFFVEDDLEKQDKQTDYSLLQCERYIYEILGLDPTIIDMWFRVHEVYNVRSKKSYLTRALSRLTGQATTALGNVLVNLIVHSDMVIRLGFNLIIMLVLGDDNTAVTTSLVNTYYNQQRIKDCYNMKSKAFIKDLTGYFCRQIIYKDENNNMLGIGPDFVRMYRRYGIMKKLLPTDSIGYLTRCLSYLIECGDTETTRRIARERGFKLQIPTYYNMYKVKEALSLHYEVSEYLIDNYYNSLLSDLSNDNWITTNVTYYASDVKKRLRVTELTDD